MPRNEHKVLLIACLLVCAGLVGCAASQAPVPEDMFYRLRVDALPSADASAPAVSVAVARLQSSGIHGARALVYHDSARPLELRQYHYHYWIDTPPRLLQDTLVSYLRQSGVAHRVLSDAPGVRTDYLINGKIQKFEENRSAAGSTVSVQLELELQRRHGREILLLKDYEESKTVEGADVHAVASAYSAAVAGIFQQFAADVGAELRR